MANTFNLVMAIILLCGFWSISVTLYSHYLPPAVTMTTAMYTGLNTLFNIDSINTQVYSGLNSQTNIPTYDVGSLLFYSGNFIFDLFANFVTALPQMVSMVFAVIFYFVGIDQYIASVIEAGAIALLGTFYGIALINMIVSIRTGRIIS